MIVAICILLVCSVILLLFDRKNRYSMLFVAMATGCTIALFSLILHINIFGNYYFFTNSPVFSLDYRIYAAIVNNYHFPFTTVLRFMNAGHFVFMMSSVLLNVEIFKAMEKYARQSKRLWLLCILGAALPVFTLVFCDPDVSTYLYILCHRDPGVFVYLQAATVLYKAGAAVTILSPVCSLLRYSAMIRMRYLRVRIWLLAACFLLVDAGYISMFYLGPFSISADKVLRSGYWNFENIRFPTHSVYLLVSIVTLILMCICLSVLLSFRLDLSTTPFLEKRVRRNLKLMNEALGDTLHSYKNTLFTLQIYAKKAKAAMGDSPSPEIEKINHVVDSSLINTGRMLDNLGAVKYCFLSSDLSSIISSAAQNVYIPKDVRLVLDDSAMRSVIGHYDKYHMEKALVNILNNAVEALSQSGRENGCINVQMAFFFRWVVVMISDNGVGMSRMVRKKLFMPHYSNKNGSLNWGLGLAYVYKIVKAHFGQIKILSQPGQYTSVLIMLPAKGIGGRSD